MAIPLLKTKKQTVFIFQLSEGFFKVARRSLANGQKGFAWDLDLSPILPDTDDKKIFNQVVGVLRRMKYNGEPVVVSLPRLNVTSRYLKVPAQDPDEIEKIVGLQASRLFPYPANELNSGFQILNTDAGGFSEVNIIIVHRAIIERYLRLCRELKANRITIALSSWGLRSLYYFLFPHERSPLTLVDVDSEIAELVVLENGKLIFSRSFRVTGSLNDWSGQCLEEIKSTWEVFGREVGREAPQKIMVLENSATSLKLIEALRSNNFNVSGLSYLRLMDIPSSNIKAKEGLSGSFASLLGLGVAEIPDNFNFLPPRMKEVTRAISQRQQIIRQIAVCVAIMVLFGLGTFLHLENKKNYLKHLKQELVKVEQQTATLEEVERRFQAFQSYSRNRLSCLEAISDLHRAIPADVSLLSFTFEDARQIILRGQAQELSLVFSFVEQLQKAPAFKDFQVKVRYATKKKGLKGEVVDFEIVCQR